MILFDGERRYMDVNRPARLVFRLPLADLRRLRIDDLTPPAFLPRLREAWARLLETGAVGGVYAVAVPGGGVLDAAYFATADALPGLHLAGNAYHGIGIPDCIRMGRAVAEEIFGFS